MTIPKTSPRSVAALLWDAADVAGDRPVVISASGVTTYAELRDRAAAIASALVARGVERGDRVAILTERGKEAAAAYFGALAAGAVAIIVNERLRPRQVEYVLRRAGVRVLMTSRELLAEHQRELETDAAVVDLATIPEVHATWMPLPPGDEGLAQIIFTSGSTGLPKGVVFSHRAILDAMEMVVGYLGFKSDERILSLLPFSSVYGLNQLLSAVMTTSAVVISLSPLAARIIGDARAHEVTCIAGVPPLWLQLLSVPAFTSTPIPSLRILQNAGGHLPPEAARQLRAAQPHARLFLQYGMTECFRSTFLPPEEVDAYPDCMGRVVPGATIWVVNEAGRLCAPGEVGELVFTGPTMAEGYWEDPEQTNATFRPAPEGSGSTARAVYSGDMVRRDEGGRFFYYSRRDRMIKSLGFRIGPDEISDVLYASGDILEAAITTEPDAVRGERIVAYVALRPGGSLQHLEQFARMELPRHMQPARIQVRETLPRLPSGKYDLPAMRASVAAG